MQLGMCKVASGVRMVGLRGNQLVDLWQRNPQLPKSLDELVAAFDNWRGDLREALDHGPVLTSSVLEWLPPIQRPGKILCVGKNYQAHAREMGAEAPEEPLIFSKLRTTLLGHEESIVLPIESDQVDYEAELVVVMGRVGRRIPVEEAWSYLAAYTCGHDVSARDWQKNKPGGQWLLGKSFDTFAPLGPFLTTADAVDNVHDLEIQLHLNGERMQHARTNSLMHSIPQLVSYISQVCTLEPGDLIFTGTPDGVGFAREPRRFLRAGDRVEITIEALGTLRNPVVGNR